MEKIKKRIANLKVEGKLKVYQMTVLVMTLFLVLVALISTVVIRSNIEKITKVWSPSLEYLQDLETMTAKYRIKQYQHLVESDAAVMNSCEEEIKKLESQIQDTDAKLEAIMSANSKAQKGQDDYEVANAAWEKYRGASDEILQLSREGKQQEASKLMTGEVYEDYKSFSKKLTILCDKFQVELDQAKTMANVCTVIIFIVIVAAGLAIAVVTTLIGKIITNSITEPVKQIDAAVASLRKGELSNVEMLTYESEDEFGDTIRNLKEAMGILADYVSEISVEVKAIAQGDLTRNGDDITDFLGDFSELKTSLLYILKRFNSTLTEISNLAEQVSSNSSEVENASKSLADGATEQAGVIEELNATIDTVVDMAEDTAKETQNASARVKASANKANEEKEKMNELLTEMEHITEISKEIGNIITDIEDIASQTNLLSLNASIEAARAGEAGKGFAVVADQIGKLAADSAKSAVNTRDLIDKYITPFLLSSDTPNFSPLAHAIARVAVFYGIGIVATYAYNRIMINVTQGMMMNMRNEMFEHMEKLPIKYFDTHAHGDIMSIYTNDIDTLRQMVSQSIPQIINSGFTIISVFISMLILNIPLTIVTLIMVAIMIWGTKKSAGQSGKYFLEQQRNLGKVNGYIEEMMNGQKVVKVFCHEEESKKEFKELNEALFVSADRANTFANFLGPMNAQIGNISYVICAIVGGALALNSVGGFTLGGLASFLTFNKSFSMPINQVSQQMNAIVMALAGAERIFTLLDEKVEVDDGYVTLVNAKEENGKLVESEKRTGRWAWKHIHQADGSVDYIELQGNVVFDGVDFGYNDAKIVLHDVKLYAEPGQKIAFVGSTGAGKTTITNLINRFYDIQDGKIRYDGININKIKKADLRHSLGIVLQDTHLFTGTVKENIRFGKLDATDEEIIAAAKLANADGFIRRLPDGYDTMITGDGANLSQGQRQLLAIARAAVADPPVLILDEATSSIDTRTERIIQESMDRLMHGRTTFVIAHRLSTVRNSDCIMVLEQGRIIERGTHDQLIEEKGKYYQLYTGNTISA